jgi:hypothetical protein
MSIFLLPIGATKEFFHRGQQKKKGRQQAAFRQSFSQTVN